MTGTSAEIKTFVKETRKETTKAGRKKAAVLGGSVLKLKEIWDDQARLELPSHITQCMSADKRQSVATIHLVITLIRLWGHETILCEPYIINHREMDNNSHTHYLGQLESRS